MPGFDWSGAATFAHGKITGPSRFWYFILANLIGLIIYCILAALFVFAFTQLTSFSKSFTDSTRTATAASDTGISVTTVVGGVVLSIFAAVWSTSFSAACYEYWRNLEPETESQKIAEGFKPYHPAEPVKSNSPSKSASSNLPSD